MKIKALDIEVTLKTTPLKRKPSGEINVFYEAKKNIVVFSDTKTGKELFAISGCDAEAVFKLCKDLHAKVSGEPRMSHAMDSASGPGNGLLQQSRASALLGGVGQQVSGLFGQL